MRLERLIICLLLFFFLSSVTARADKVYYMTPVDPPQPDGNYKGMDAAPVFYWQLPLWIQLFYVGAMAAAFLGLLRFFPVVVGKIDDLLKNENRHNILNYIVSNPGTTIAGVSQAQNLERATVRYHLYKLENEGKIIVDRVGRYSRIFRNSHTYSDFEKTVIAHLQNPAGRSVLLLILEHPGITNQEMADELGVEKSAVHWHIDRLMRDGLVSYRQDKKFKRYFIGENAQVLLEKYTTSLA